MFHYNQGFAIQISTRILYAPSKKMRPLISSPKKAFEKKSAFTNLYVFTLLEIII